MHDRRNTQPKKKENVCKKKKKIKHRCKIRIYKYLLNFFTVETIIVRKLKQNVDGKYLIDR